MQRQQISIPFALCAFGLSVAAFALAAIQLTSGPFAGQYERPVEYFNDAALLGVLVFAIGAEIGLRRANGGSSWALRTAIVGQSLLIIGITIGMALAEDPDWFLVIGAPGQLLWLIGTIGLGVQTFRSGVFPRWTGIGVGLSVPFGIIGAEAGLTAVVGITWLVIGYKMLGDVKSEERLPATSS